MSSTIRDAAEHTVHTITDLVSDAMQHIDMPHIDMPHIDMARVTGGRRSTSPAAVAAIVAALVVVAVLAARALRGRKATPVLDETIAGPSKKGKKTPVSSER